MIKFKINKMDNAYGIGSLKPNFDSDSLFYQELIYSSNGTFKTSFSRTLNDLSTGNKESIKDRLTDIPSSIDIDFISEDGKISKNNYENRFIVFSREILETNTANLSNYNSDLSFLTTDKDSKDKLNKLMVQSTEKIKDSIRSKLKLANLNVDKSVICLIDKDLDSLNINELQSLLEYVKDVEDSDISKINLKNLFQKAYDPIDSKEFKSAAMNYVKIFNNRLSEELFDENFNDNNCFEFLTEIKKYNYLSEKSKRGITLLGKEYYEYEDIEKIFSDAINKISKDPKVLSANKDLVKAMGTSVEAKKLQVQFTKEPLLINQLSLGKKNIVAISLKESKLEVEEFLKLIDDTKKEYSEIIKEATAKKSQFEAAIEIYKNRFNPVFNIVIKNKVESILGESIPILSFTHKRFDGKELSESQIRELLSSGEKTALNIITFIVEYEAKKFEDPILILDDIVETFDYANRHAFIEYIEELVNSNVTIIILTHNYEFYRTLGLRVPKLTQLSAYSKNGKVFIEKNDKLNKNIENVFEIHNIEELIFSIPYLREIRKMEKQETKILDNCLHYKQETKKITIGEIRSLFTNEITFNDNDSDNYFEILFKVADKINVDNKYNIVSKTILSIACRLMIESKIINNNFTLIDDINRNQLSQIKEKYHNDLTDKALSLIDKVQISTPEFIHCNSFMYEPLIDIDGKYLFDLYNEELKKLTPEEVWKNK